MGKPLSYDPERKCPKYPGVGTLTVKWDTGPILFNIPTRDAMLITCSCGYTWHEEPAERTMTLSHYRCAGENCRHPFDWHEVFYSGSGTYYKCGEKGCECGHFIPDVSGD